ncbi:MAG: magnesium transporter [cyanobacterium endosymbiont of Rhopalodia musculus]|uniref:magnesium transporter n=1 Tax=cyanobacterium endosymbiont of Epithemia clementina EcSB TaxID=3034674 RepID=UPI0024815BCF|nr:magnesium transporter [cyanobacterium endosymbiont of Epithemia clementina EcSB]WGT68030.1 magnesium transporter [cyanobacterium endosymbiont of Epithemia clementina EcSB]
MMNADTTTPIGSPNKLRELVRIQLQLLLEQKNYEGVKTLLVPVQPVDIAEAIEDLPKTLQIIAFRLLTKSEAIDVYEYLDPIVQQSLIKEFHDQEAIAIVNDMSPDDRAKLFDELPPKLVRRLIAQIAPKEREVTALLLGYQSDNAGRLMTPEYIALKEHLTATKAQEKLRTLAHKSEVNYYIYVTDINKRLIGILSLKDLIIAEPDQTLGEIMTQDVIYTYTNTDQEEVARLIQRYDLLALPIVDKDENLLGVITVDDVIDIIQEEVTEDFYKMVAVESQGDNYFQVGLFEVVKKRIPWLLLLLITNSVTVIILSQYEAVLDEAVALAFFTPLLIGAGGNVGAQSSTVVIRGLSTEALRDKKPVSVIIRELVSGGLLGIILGSLVIIGIFLFLGHQEVGLTVGISLLVISIIAATTGAAFPYIFKSFGLDPALMSAPFITTIVDILGIFIYINLARLFLGI